MNRNVTGVVNSLGFDFDCNMNAFRTTKVVDGDDIYLGSCGTHFNARVGDSVSFTAYVKPYNTNRRLYFIRRVKNLKIISSGEH